MEPVRWTSRVSSVSVVVPAYNAARTIGRALQSISDQTSPQIGEVIVVDDGSTDGTGEIVAERFPQVRLCRQANSGPGCARNTGVEMAKGDYVAFLDADDEWLPFKTEVQMEVAARCPGASVIGSNALCVPEGDAIPIERKAQRPRTITLQQRWFGWALRTLRVLPASSMLIPRGLFIDAGGYSGYRVGEDLDFNLRLLNNGHTAIFIEEPMVIGYLSPSSTSAPVEARMQYARNTIAVLRNLEPSRESIQIVAPEAYAAVFRYHCRRNALWAMRWGRVRLGLSFLAESPAAPTGFVDDLLRAGAATITRYIQSRSGEAPRRADRLDDC